MPPVMPCRTAPSKCFPFVPKGANHGASHPARLHRTGHDPAQGRRRAHRQGNGPRRCRLAPRRRADDRGRPGRRERQGRDKPRARHHTRRPGDRGRQAHRRAPAGAALALLQAPRARDDRARRKGPPDGVRVAPRRHAPGDERRAARPQFRGSAAADQRRRAEAAAGTADDRLAAQVPGPRQRPPERGDLRSPPPRHHHRRRGLPADGHLA